MSKLSLQFLRGGTVRAITAILVIEIVAFYVAPTAEYVPHPPTLSSFQRDAGDWKTVQVSEIDPETMAFLRADDTVSRVYNGPGGPLTFFVAFFKSQRGGVTPHSPKICLPGAGWTPEASDIISVSVPGESGPVSVNRYIVRHGENRSLVLYWYATAHRVIANEYVAKINLMYEGLRYRRSDEAVYRVIIPIVGNEDAAQDTAIHFIQTVYEPLKQQMWSAS